MAWQTDLVLIVRNLINDLGTPPTYSDERIELAIVISGLLVSQDYDLTVDYVFDFTTPNITPDPTVAPMDNIMIALISLRASCLLLSGTYTSSVTSGTGGAVKIKDGSSEIQVSDSFGGHDAILKNGPCLSYASLLKSLIIKRSGTSGRAVLSPFSSGLYGYAHLGNIRDFYNQFLYW